MATKVWNWNNFRGGLSDTHTIGAEGSFQDGKYVDVQSEPNGVRISTIPVVKYETTARTTGFCKSNAGTFSHSADGKIYDTNDGSLDYTLTAGVTNKLIYHIVPRNETGTMYHYIFTEARIHRGTSDFGTVTENYKTTSGIPQATPFIYGGTIYFTSGIYLYTLDIAGTLTAAYTFPAGVELTGMTFFQDTLRVYGNDGNDAFLYIFNISDLVTPIYITRFEKTSIGGATNAGSIDYVLAGTVGYYDLYIFSGTQRQLTKASLEGSAAIRNFNGKCDTRIEDPYFVSTGGSRNGIYKYAEMYPGIPRAMTRIFDNASRDVYSVFCESSSIWIGYKDASDKYQVASIRQSYPDTYNTEGELISLITDFGDPYVKKNIDQVEISYDCDNSDPQFPHGGEIELYARKKRSQAWQLIADTGVLSDVGCKLFTHGSGFTNFGDFYKVEFRLVLKRGSTSLSPLVNGVRITVTEQVN